MRQISNRLKQCKILSKSKIQRHNYHSNSFSNTIQLKRNNKNQIFNSLQYNIFKITKNYFSATQSNVVNTNQNQHYISISKASNKIENENVMIPTRSTVILSTIDTIGALENILAYFRKYNINLTRIESRYSQVMNQVTFCFDLELPFYDKILQKVKQELQKLNTISSIEIVDNKKHPKVIPWFPMTLEEVDSLALLVLQGGEDLQADHPGFNDKDYRKRREEIAEYAKHFKFGDEIPVVKYTKDEIECWNTIWSKLHPMLLKHGCDEYLESLEALQKNVGGYGLNFIPQLKDITSFLLSRTGFRLRPTAGLISSRHFLNGLAFKVFFCTQYIRHHSVPFYTPEPDVCHELVGHTPLFANPEFARFSQEIGLASIGATDEQIVELARCYWFSVEFGLCRKTPQSNERKAYGAGILSSFGELEYAMSNEPEIRDWDPFAAAKQEYPITKYQPVYYLANSFEDAKHKMQEYAFSLDKPFSVRWDEQNEKLIVDRNIVRGERNMKDFGTYVGTE